MRFKGLDRDWVRRWSGGNKFQNWGVLVTKQRYNREIWSKKIKKKILELRRRFWKQWSPILTWWVLEDFFTDKERSFATSAANDCLPQNYIFISFIERKYWFISWVKREVSEICRKIWPKSTRLRIFNEEYISNRQVSSSLLWLTHL